MFILICRIKPQDKNAISKIVEVKEKNPDLSMVKVWFNVFPKHWEDAVDKVIQRTRIPNVVSNFRKKTEVNSANLIHQPHLEIITFEA